MPSTPHDRRHLHDITLAARVAPGLCSALILLGVWIAEPEYFLALVPFALVGAIWGRHPIDVVYSELLAPILRTDPVPSCGAPRRFAGGAAAAWLVLLAVAFENGATLTGGLLAGLMAAGAFMTATLYLCLPCFAYVRLFTRRAVVHVWNDSTVTKRIA